MNHYHVFGKKLEVLKHLTWFTLSHLSSLYFVHRSKVGSIDSSQIITATSDVKFKLSVWWNIVRPLESISNPPCTAFDRFKIACTSRTSVIEDGAHNYSSVTTIALISYKWDEWQDQPKPRLDRAKTITTKEGIVI